jgi:hypothetical protein
MYGIGILMIGCASLSFPFETAWAQKLPGTTTVSGTTTTSISPDGRLRLQLLVLHGDVLFTANTKRHNCNTFGTNYVLVGLKVRHRVTSLAGIDLFCAPLRADGSMGTSIFLPATVPAEGAAHEVKCPAGQAVAGYQGMRDNSGTSPQHLRSITLFCAKLGANGLLEGTPAKTLPLGVNSGIAFGPDMCSSGRPASEMRLAVARLYSLPTTVGAWRLGCEQPERP